MSPHDGSDRLSTDLQKLETPAASADFTERVLAALDARSARRRRRRVLGVALAVPAAIAVLVGALMLTGGAPAPQIANAAELKRQHEMLQAELARLQQARDQSRAVLYLGTGEDYDLVLDLEPLLAQSIRAPEVPAFQDLRAQPARGVETARRRP